MIFKSNSISGIVRRAVFLVFVGALVFGSAVFYLFYSAASMRHVEDEARAILRLAQATRQFTAEEITPLVTQMDPDKFHAVQVPSYAAHAVFRRVVLDDEAYAYREAALNPTNPDDLADEFERGLINTFRGNKDLEEQTGIHWHDDEVYFYISRPIAIHDATCLSCHSTPESAPSAMVAQYGSTAGFGWSMGEVVGAQVLTVPVGKEYRSVFELVAIFAGMLLIFFLLVSLMVTLPLQREVIRPVRQLAKAAERSSLRNENVELPTSSADEIATLSGAISRLRTSLGLMLKE